MLAKNKDFNLIGPGLEAPNFIKHTQEIGFSCLRAYPYSLPQEQSVGVTHLSCFDFVLSGGARRR